MRKALLASLLLFAACATNPVTHKREFNIVSESQEIAMGQETHPQIVRQYGIYQEKPELNRLVDQVGQRLAAVSDRPKLQWHFTVLDTPMVNAMAIPGGYVYVTRGMLERINSEDELAGVLGHEITHVTARHAAQQMSRAQLAQIGLVLGSVVAGPEVTQSVGQLAELGLNLLFLRYGRGQESQADQVGTRYAAKAAYNPVGVERMLTTLMRLDKHPAEGLDKYFLSHPDPAKRVRDVQGEIKKLVAENPSVTAVEPKRAPYVQLVDGMMTGNSTSHVTIRGATIYDRDHGMILTAPAGWIPSAGEGGMFSMAPKASRGGQQQAFVAQEIDLRELQGFDAQNGVRNKLQQMGLQYLGSRQQVRMQSGQQVPVDVWQGQTESGMVGVETAQFPHGDHVAVFMFLTPQLSQSQSPLGAILSRAVIDPERARSAPPARIRVETAKSGDTWQSLARRATTNPNDAEAIANMNGFDLKDPVRAGMVVKLPSEVPQEAQQ